MVCQDNIRDETNRYQISSTLVKSFDKVVEILAEIGHCLPHFGKYAEIFKENSQMKGILCLFYKDILDFYCTTLNFFGKSSEFTKNLI